MTIIEFIKQYNNILVVGHVRPDGDCFGAGLAIRYLCRKYGKEADFVCDSALSEHYAFLPDYDKVNLVTCRKYDSIIAVDCGDELRMGKYTEYLSMLPCMNIDHHISNKGFGKYNIIFPDKSSTCEIIGSILDELDELDDYIAYMLYVGMSTDTGHFRHSNTSESVLKLAGRLLEFGFDPYPIVCNLYRSNTVAQTMLMGRAINNIRFYEDNKICIIALTKRDLDDCNCVLADTEGIIDIAISIKGIVAAVCMTESANCKFKVSFRSNGLDVSKSASVFGGGGHKQAAGCIVCGKLEDAVQKVLKSITDEMNV